MKVLAYGRTALLPFQVYIQLSCPPAPVCIGVGSHWTGMEGFVLGVIKLKVFVFGSQPCYSGYRSAVFLSVCFLSVYWSLSQYKSLLIVCSCCL
jgi:hypothetical protein